MRNIYNIFNIFDVNTIYRHVILGCLCVIGKDSEGRDITERRMKDSDCKCQPNERSRECPAPGA